MAKKSRKPQKIQNTITTSFLPFITVGKMDISHKMWDKIEWMLKDHTETEATMLISMEKNFHTDTKVLVRFDTKTGKTLNTMYQSKEDFDDFTDDFVSKMNAVETAIKELISMFGQISILRTGNTTSVTKETPKNVDVSSVSKKVAQTTKKKRKTKSKGYHVKPHTRKPHWREYSDGRRIWIDEVRVHC